MSIVKRLLAPLVLGSLLVVTSCSSSSASLDTEQVASSIIIDVRTPEEFSAGHLDGAVNYDVSDGTLEMILSSLDPQADYIIYCRSGNRSAVAVDIMKSAGFTSMVDLGSMENASSETGIAIVQ
jgi:rhodanese-related sulfurtransferase